MMEGDLEVWRESVVGLTIGVAIESLRWRVRVCGGGYLLFMVWMRSSVKPSLGN